jgi:hypothetical protein
LIVNFENNGTRLPLKQVQTGPGLLLLGGAANSMKSGVGSRIFAERIEGFSEANIRRIIQIISHSKIVPFLLHSNFLTEDNLTNLGFRTYEYTSNVTNPLLRPLINLIINSGVLRFTSLHHCDIIMGRANIAEALAGTNKKLFLKGLISTFIATRGDVNDAILGCNPGFFTLEDVIEVINDMSSVRSFNNDDLIVTDAIRYLNELHRMLLFINTESIHKYRSNTVIGNLEDVQKTYSLKVIDNGRMELYNSTHRLSLKLNQLTDLLTILSLFYYVTIDSLSSQFTVIDGVEGTLHGGMTKDTLVFIAGVDNNLEEINCPMVAIFRDDFSNESSVTTTQTKIGGVVVNSAFLQNGRVDYNRSRHLSPEAEQQLKIDLESTVHRNNEVISTLPVGTIFSPRLQHDISNIISRHNNM